MLRVAIVEDDSLYASQLEEYVARFARENSQEIQTSRFSDGMDIAEDYTPVWDIILLDIEMPLLDGMSTAERIREHDPSVLIVFITNMAQYAIQGYSVNALDYVLKPINYYSFSMKMRKACRILEERPGQSLLLTREGETVRVPVRDILYVEVADHQLVYHTTKGDFREFGTLKKLEDSLGAGFGRCNHCYLINLKHLDGIRDECAVVGGESLKISRARKKAFLQQVSDFYRFGGR